MTAKSDTIKSTANGDTLARKSESLWADAVRRLVRNRAAVMGISIILLLLLAAIFAPYIAPRTFAEQVLVDNNKVPERILVQLTLWEPITLAAICSAGSYLVRACR